jgi:hypothetical protein
MDFNKDKLFRWSWKNSIFLVVMLSYMLVACGGSPSGPASNPTATTSVGQTPPPTSPPPQTSASMPELKPQEVQSWCSPIPGSSGTCDISLFEWPVVETNGVRNPYGVHMKPQNPVAFNVPGGILIDVWDCFKYSRVSGPIKLAQVCEATFRRVS